MSALREQGHDPLLTADQAAEHLGLSAYTIRQMARRREIPAVKLGKLWRFRQSSVDQWVAARERAAR